MPSTNPVLTELPTVAQWYATTRERIDDGEWGEVSRGHLVALGGGLKGFLTDLDHFASAKMIHFEREKDFLSGYLIFRWLEKAKRFSLLWRDILFEAQKAVLLVDEELVPSSSALQLAEMSRGKLREAAEEIFTDLQRAEERSRPLMEEIEGWARQSSPWPVYKAQFAEIAVQADDLVDHFGRTTRLASDLASIRIFFGDNLARCARFLEQTKTVINGIIEKVKNDPENVSLTEAIRLLEDNQAAEPDYLTASDFGDRLDGLLAQLPGDAVFLVNVHAGQLQQEEFSVFGRVSNWLQSELMSLVYDYYQDRRQLREQLSMTVLALRNRLEYDRREEKKSEAEDVLPILDQLREKVMETGKQMGLKVARIESELTDELNAGSIYQPPFLPTTVSPTINRYRRYQEIGFRAVGDWLSSKLSAFNRFRSANQREEQLSVSERIVRLVRARQPDPENSHYTNLFLTAGYIGESFRVGREAEMERAGQLVDNWKLGYRGALLLTGKRFSGKTFLGEMIGYRYFSGNTISLQPGKTIELSGRKFAVEANLGAALEFVVKYQPSGSPPMVWIDDLHRWQNEKVNLAENVRALLNTIDYHSGKIFFALSVDPGLLGQLRRFLDIERYFQAEIEAQPMRLEEIKEAILIRHGATQNKLVNTSGEELEEKQLDQLIKRVHRRSGGVVGEALRRWAFTLRWRGDNMVSPDETRFFILPDYLNENAGLLLRAIFVDRISQEYLLRRQFGPAFKTVFQPILQRFLHLGVVHRHLDGKLEINPFLVGEVGELLRRRELLPTNDKPNNQGL